MTELAKLLFGVAIQWGLATAFTCYAVLGGYTSVFATVFLGQTLSGNQGEIGGIRATFSRIGGFPGFGQPIAHIPGLKDGNKYQRNRHERDDHIRQSTGDGEPPIQRRLVLFAVCVLAWLGCFWRFFQLLLTGSDRRAYWWGYVGVGFLSFGLLLLFLAGVPATWGWWL